MQSCPLALARLGIQLASGTSLVLQPNSCVEMSTQADAQCGVPRHDKPYRVGLANYRAGSAIHIPSQIEDGSTVLFLCERRDDRTQTIGQ
jgi:hypothetical protein